MNTPRTDAAFNGDLSGGVQPELASWKDAADFARTLERELAEEKRALQYCRMRENNAIVCYAMERAKADQLKLELDCAIVDSIQLGRMAAAIAEAMPGFQSAMGSECDNAECALAAIVKERDQLRDAHKLHACTGETLLDTLNRLRSAADSWERKAAEYAAEREHNANVASQLRAEVGQLREQNLYCVNRYLSAERERDALRAEIERLKNQTTAILDSHEKMREWGDKWREDAERLAGQLTPYVTAAVKHSLYSKEPMAALAAHDALKGGTQ